MQVAFTIWTHRFLLFASFLVMGLTALLLGWSETGRAQARSLVERSDIIRDLNAITADEIDPGVITVLELHEALKQNEAIHPSDSSFVRLIFGRCNLRRDPAVRSLATAIMRETRKDRTFKNAVHREHVTCILGEQFDQQTLGAAWLQNVYFGDGVYGIDAAAHYYFEISTARLSDQQAAILVALIAAPNLASANSEALLDRGNAVLERSQVSSKERKLPLLDSNGD